MEQWSKTAWLVPACAVVVFGLAQGCGAGESSTQGKAAGQSCTQGAECASGACQAEVCTGAALGAACSSDGACASGHCINGVCSSSAAGTGTAGSNGTAGSSGTATGGGSMVHEATGNPTTTGALFPGSGEGYRPLVAGCGPETATDCTGTCEQAGGSTDVEVVRDPATLCFYGADLDSPAVTIEQVVEAVGGEEYIHLRITFNPEFVDNTYGEGSVGWSPVRGHRYSDLVGSDHTEILLTDGNADTVMHVKVDYISEDANAACGYSSLGVTGGDGEVLIGDAAHVLAVATSLTRNLNHCGYTECYTEDSPLTDENFSPNPATPEWDYRAVYEVWVSAEAFGDAGFGQAYMTYVHASPAKTPEETLELTPGPCPPDWDEPYCPEGASCAPPPDGGTYTECPPNYTIYLATEGQSECVPIPFSGYPNMEACPEGYYLDLASEGRYCLLEE